MKLREREAAPVLRTERVKRDLGINATIKILSGYINQSLGDDVKAEEFLQSLLPEGINLTHILKNVSPDEFLMQNFIKQLEEVSKRDKRELPSAETKIKSLLEKVPHPEEALVAVSRSFSTPIPKELPLVFK